MKSEIIKPTLSHAISVERHTFERFREVRTWAEAFDQVGLLFLQKERRLLYMISRSEIGKREPVRYELVDMCQIHELEDSCQDTVTAVKFQVMDIETKEQVSSIDQTLVRAIVLVYMCHDEWFTDLDLAQLEF
ncbi:MAG: hypothetical protein ABI643_00365 [Candidatus Doudnabacteria bacterium]